MDQGKSLTEARHFLKKPGGAPTNVAAAIAALGGKVELAAKVGNDPFGKQLIDTLNAFGVSTQWMLKDEEHFTTIAFVSLLENGEPDFVFSRGADRYLSKEDLQYIDLDDFSIIHFGSATAFLPGPLQSAYRGLLQRAIMRDLYISFDPNYRHLLFRDNKPSFISQSWDFLAESHFLKLSKEEAMLLTGTNTAADAATVLFKKTNAVFAISLGKDGALLGFKGKTEIVPGTNATVIDTTGAGDAFAGAILYQLNKKPVAEIKTFSLQDWKAIVANANKAGAITCEHLGAMEAFNHLSAAIL